MAEMMGLGIIGNPNVCFKRKFRWMFKLDGIAGNGGATPVLPPEKSARPSVSFKEIEVQHLNETILFPGKVEWKPINLVLFDLKLNKNPVFEWLKEIYVPKDGDWKFPIGSSANAGFKRQTAIVELYDGCGNTLERWVYENIWPQQIEWGELDMGSSDYLTAELTLRYDRAYIEE